MVTAYLTVKKNDNNYINKGHWLPGITIREKYQEARWQVNFFFVTLIFFMERTNFCSLIKDWTLRHHLNF